MATLWSKPSVLFFATLVLVYFQGGHGFLPLRNPSRLPLTPCRLQIPSEIPSLFPTSSNTAQLEGVSWADPGLYGGLPLAAESEMVSPFSLDTATALLDSLSWAEVGLYGGLPLAVLAVVLTQPPSKLITDKELEQITQGTNLQGRSDITCIYKASRDGWSATQFHDKVDNLGSAVVVARSLTGQIFGGYNPAGWRSTDDYVTSTQAFLWARNTGSNIAKFPVLPGGNAAVFDYATSGPNFGAGDLQIGPSQAAVMGGFAGPDAEDISTSAGNLRKGKSVAGITYDITAAWPARGNLVLTEVEVYGRP
eukprot:scaffold1007_cov176-Amphora_coffeaeformis.AAC.3